MGPRKKRREDGFEMREAMNRFLGVSTGFAGTSPAGNAVPGRRD